MPNDFLHKIVDYKKELVGHKRSFYNQIKKSLSQTMYSRYSLFKKQLANPGPLSIIAEIKKASPSKGMIRADFDLNSIARSYAKHQASVISILTEDKFFLGKPEYIKKVSNEVNLPLLAKDFFIDEGQVYEARYNGASAILLIMAILSDTQFRALMRVASDLDLDCLVEVHDQPELERALGLNADIIGINNRNLKTFEVRLETCQELIPLIPKDKVIVAESGIRTAGDMKYLADLGANAVLIGETFMRENNIGAKVDELRNYYL